MNSIRVIMLRELRSYFATPLAYVYIVIFLMLAGVSTFALGGFYVRGQADLRGRLTSAEISLRGAGRNVFEQRRDVLRGAMALSRRGKRIGLLVHRVLRTWGGRGV